MSLWSKGIDRSLSDDPRIEDFNPELIFKDWGIEYISINKLLDPYKKPYIHCTKIDLNKSQIIRWGVYKWDRLSRKMELRGHAFIITDSVNKSYMYYSNCRLILTAGDYSQNLLSNKKDVKSTFIQTLNRMNSKRIPSVYNITPEELKELKKTLKPINNIINKHRTNKHVLTKWLNM